MVVYGCAVCLYEYMTQSELNECGSGGKLSWYQLLKVHIQ